MIIIFVMDAHGSMPQRSGPPARKAVGAAGVFIAGILAHPILPSQPLNYLLVLAVCCGLSAALWRFPRTCCIFLGGGLFIAAVLAAQLEKYAYPRGHIAALAGSSPHLARLEAEIIDPPRVLADSAGRFRNLPARQFVAASVRSAGTWNGRQPFEGEVLMQLAEPNPRLRQGQVVRVTGLLQHLGESMNPGQFDWYGSYRDRRVTATLHAPHAGNVHIFDDAPRLAESSWLAPLWEARQYVRRVLARGFSAQRSLDHALLRALLLGDRDTQLRDVQEQFKRTGTGHHLAISGMHVAILGGVVAFLCRLMCLAPRTSLCVAMGFIIIYGLLALPSPPVVRSVLLCGAYALGKTRRRSLGALQLLAVCALVMLIIAPLDLYNAGFQLSFFTVAGLAMFTDGARGWIHRLRSEDDRVLESFGRTTRWQAVRRWIWHRGAEVLAVGAVAWLVSAPLIALHFQQLNTWAIPGSIALAPIVFCSLIGGILKILLTILWPSAAVLWAEAAAWPIIAMRHTVDLLAALPGADVPLASHWRWLTLALYPAALLLCVPVAMPQRWLRHLPAAAACVMLPLLPMLLGLSSRESSTPAVRITALAVGAGSCNVIELPDGRVSLIDCGSSTLFDLTRRCLGPYLRYFGHDDIERLFLSHANYDHFSAAEEVVDAYDVEDVFISPAFVAHAVDNPPAVNLLGHLREINRPPTLVSESRVIELGGGARVQVLWPPAQGFEMSPNDCSMVLRLTCAGRSILFTGDIESAAQRELLKNPSRLKSDILVAPHHGSMERNTLEFIRAVNPKYIVSSNDRVLSMKQRQFDEAIRREGIAHYRTHTSGAVTIDVTRDGELQVTPYLHKAQE